MSRCISSLVKHFNQVARKPPFFLRFFLRTRFKKVIQEGDILTVSSSGFTLFSARWPPSVRSWLPAYALLLRVWATNLPLPIRLPIRWMIYGSFSYARSRFGNSLDDRHESLSRIFLLKYSATMIILFWLMIDRCNKLIKRISSIFAALFVQRDHPVVESIYELSEKEGRKEHRRKGRVVILRKRKGRGRDGKSVS